MPTPKGAMCQPPLYNALAQWQDTSTIAFFQAGRQLLEDSGASGISLLSSLCADLFICPFDL